MRAFYESNLALIHNAGFGALAVGAGRMALRHLRGHAGPHAALIDLGCGSGVLAEQVSVAGYEVTGIDLSPHLIHLARQRVPLARFVQGSFFDMDLPRASVVTMIGECINYIDDDRPQIEDLRALFGRFAQALEPGGLFLFDAAAPGRVPGGHAQVFTHAPEWTVLMESREDGDVLRRDITTFRRAGDLYRREGETHLLRLWEPEALIGLLRDAGFRVERFTHYDDVALPQGSIGYSCIRTA
jgi:SAM-dependent methyltransferase